MAIQDDINALSVRLAAAAAQIEGFKGISTPPSGSVDLIGLTDKVTAVEQAIADVKASQTTST